jgi:trehalose/maltose hydrolase-like predicted phosphorylase
LPYDEASDLWLEDDTWLRRKPVDMAKAKPTAKRIIDTAIPYEALPLYQITKQADVLHVMKNLPWRFTRAQIQTAFDHYRPRTAFDSSLSYSMFALMAARLGRADEALGFFGSCVNLDIRNVQLNTISGLHFANFGGTWQAAVFGFGGVSVLEDRLDISPNLPSGWTDMAFRLHYQGARIQIRVTHDRVQGELLQAASGPIALRLCGRDFTLAEVGDMAQVTL